MPVTILRGIHQPNIIDEMMWLQYNFDVVIKFNSKINTMELKDFIKIDGLYEIYICIQKLPGISLIHEIHFALFQVN